MEVGLACKKKREQKGESVPSVTETAHSRTTRKKDVERASVGLCVCLQALDS